MPEKFSRKREALYNALRATTVHPTAEWLYAALRPEYPDLSLGTVYRNLKKFCAEGKARSVGVINGQEHFDGDTSAHSHFVCDCCGRVLDIFEPLVDTETLERIEAEHGFTITKEDLLFGGVCAECKEKSKNKKPQTKINFRRILLWQSLYAPYVVTFLKAKQLRSSAPYVRHRLPSSRSRKRT